MTKVTQTFTSDDKDLVKSLDRLNAKLTKLEEANKKLKETSKAAGDEAQKSVLGQFRGIRKIETGYAAVEIVLGRINDHYAEQRAQIEKTTSAALDLQKQTLNLASGGASVQKLADFFDAAAKSGKGTRAEAADAFGEVQKEAPGVAFARQQEIAGAALEGSSAGFNETKFAALLAALEKLQPGKTAKELQDLGAAATEKGVTAEEVSAAAESKSKTAKRDRKKLLARIGTAEGGVAGKFTREQEEFAATEVGRNLSEADARRIELESSEQQAAKKGLEAKRVEEEATIRANKGESTVNDVANREAKRLDESGQAPLAGFAAGIAKWIVAIGRNTDATEKNTATNKTSPTYNPDGGGNVPGS